MHSRATIPLRASFWLRISTVFSKLKNGSTTETSVIFLNNYLHFLIFILYHSTCLFFLKCHASPTRSFSVLSSNMQAMKCFDFFSAAFEDVARAIGYLEVYWDEGRLSESVCIIQWGKSPFLFKNQHACLNPLDYSQNKIFK